MLVQDAGDLIMADLDAAQIQAAAITQVNSVIVTQPTATYITLTTLNPIPATGGVQIRLPKWNSQAPAGIRESYLLDKAEFNTEDSN